MQTSSHIWSAVGGALLLLVALGLLLPVDGLNVTTLPASASFETLTPQSIPPTEKDTARGANFPQRKPAPRKVIVQPEDSLPKPDSAPDCVFMPSPPQVVEAMLKLAEVKPGEVVFDLGCGDGRICIAAAQKHQAWAFGYDIDPERIQESLKNVKENKVEHLVTIERRNIFKLDLSGADVVTMWLLPTLNVRLIPQLEKMKPGSRIVSEDFDMRGVKPDKVIKVQAPRPALWTGKPEPSVYCLYLWKTPLKKDQK